MINDFEEYISINDNVFIQLSPYKSKYNVFVFSASVHTWVLSNSFLFKHDAIAWASDPENLN
jgi:hypothetical protein